MMFRYALFALLTAVYHTRAAPSLRARAGEVLYELNNVGGTVYYDIHETPDNDPCGRTPGNEGAPFPPMWANSTGMINPVTKCATKTGAKAMGLKDMGTSRVVAMDASLMNQDLMAWCGKEVKIFQNGVEFTIEDGPFILWDTCDDCVKNPHVDLSVAAFVGLSPGGICRNNVAGLKVQVLNNQVWNPPYDETWRPGGNVRPGPVPVNRIPPGGVQNTTVSPGTSGAPVVKSSAASSSVVPSAGRSGAAPAPSGGVGATQKPTDACPSKGANRCSGLQLEICNYVGSPYPYLDWVTSGPPCKSYCDIAKAPMCG